MCCNKKKGVISRISSYLFQHMLLFAGTLFLACFMTILSVAAPSVIQQVLDSVFQNGMGNGDILFKGILLIAGLFFMKEFLNFLRIRINNKYVLYTNHFNS